MGAWPTKGPTPLSSGWPDAAVAVGEAAATAVAVAGGRGRAGGWRQRRMDSRVSELFGGCCRPGGGPAVGGTLKARGAGGSSGCGGPKGKKKNGRNRGGKANNPPYLPPEVSPMRSGG